jgi:hypothetical protein
MKKVVNLIASGTSQAIAHLTNIAIVGPKTRRVVARHYYHNRVRLHWKWLPYF